MTAFTEAIVEDAFRKLARVGAPSLVERNRAVHRMLVDTIRRNVTIDLTIRENVRTQIGNHRSLSSASQFAIDRHSAPASRH